MDFDGKSLEELFQLNDVHQIFTNWKWLETTKHPFYTGCLGLQVYTCSFFSKHVIDMVHVFVGNDDPLVGMPGSSQKHEKCLLNFTFIQRITYPKNPQLDPDQWFRVNDPVLRRGVWGSSK